MDHNPLLTPREVAGILRISTNTLQNWRCQKLGPKYTRLGGKTVRYHAADVQAFAHAGPGE